MFEGLDTLIHSPLRLAIMSLLVSVEEAEFNVLKEKTEATSGNLSIQIRKLVDAGYVHMEKSYRNNFPLTTYSITDKGISAFEKYVDSIRKYIDIK